jgi:hypothetical protein
MLDLKSTHLYVQNFPHTKVFNTSFQRALSDSFLEARDTPSFLQLERASAAHR